MPEQPTDPYHVPNAQPFRPAPRSQTPPADENEDSLLHAFFVDTPSQPETPPAELSEQEPQPGMSRRTLIATGVLLFIATLFIIYAGAEDSAGPRPQEQSAATIRYTQLKNAAEHGDARACYELALCYEQGLGTAVNATEAQRLLKLAAQAQLPEANLRLADAAYTKQNYTDAAEYYRAASTQLNAEQAFRLAHCIEMSAPNAAASQEVITLYTHAADQGHAEAAFTLGLYYYKGNGVSLSHQNAIERMQRAAEQGHLEAQFHLGWMLLQEHEPTNRSLALHWLTRAAEQGHAAACYNLYIQLNADGDAASRQRALAYLQQAAQQKYPAAQFTLSFRYSEGNGVPKDPKQAVRLLEEAAHAGHPQAQYHFAWCLHHGYARHASLSAALPWYLKAAAQHDAKAQEVLDKLWCMKLAKMIKGITNYDLRVTNF